MSSIKIYKIKSLCKRFPIPMAKVVIIVEPMFSSQVESAQLLPDIVSGADQKSLTLKMHKLLKVMLSKIMLKKYFYIRLPLIIYDTLFLWLWYVWHSFFLKSIEPMINVWLSKKCVHDDRSLHGRPHCPRDQEQRPRIVLSSLRRQRMFSNHAGSRLEMCLYFKSWYISQEKSLFPSPPVLNLPMTERSLEI